MKIISLKKRFFSSAWCVLLYCYWATSESLSLAYSQFKHLFKHLYKYSSFKYFKYLLWLWLGVRDWWTDKKRSVWVGTWDSHKEERSQGVPQACPGALSGWQSVAKIMFQAPSPLVCPLCCFHLSPPQKPRLSINLIGQWKKCRWHQALFRPEFFQLVVFRELLQKSKAKFHSQWKQSHPAKKCSVLSAPQQSNSFSLSCCVGSSLTLKHYHH